MPAPKPDDAVEPVLLSDPAVAAFDMDNAFGFLFRRLNSLANMLFINLSGQADVTPIQMGILVKVQQAGLIPLRELARQMHVDNSTLQEVVRRMVNKGLLSRRTPPNDKRSHELWLGPEGVQTLRKHFGAMKSLQDRILEGVPAGDAEITARTLRTILDRHDF